MNLVIVTLDGCVRTLLRITLRREGGGLGPLIGRNRQRALLPERQKNTRRQLGARVDAQSWAGRRRAPVSPGRPQYQQVVAVRRDAWQRDICDTVMPSPEIVVQ